MLKKTLVLLMLAIGATAVFSTLALAPVTAYAQQGKIGNKVGKPLKKAKEAADSKDYKSALEFLKEADAISGKSAYEQFTINELYGFVYVQQRQYANAAKVYERNLNSGQQDPATVNDRLKLLAQLTFQSQPQKSADFGTRWLKATGQKDPAILSLVGQAYFVSKDYQNTIPYMADAINASQKAGKRPDENWLLIMQQSYYKLNDAKGVNNVLDRLVRLYPKTEYWDALTSNLLRGAPNDDRVVLNIYRLMYELDVMKTAEDYAEMAIIALQLGLPGEAERVMSQGYARKILDTSGDTGRSQRIMAQAKKAAADDRKTLPTVEKEAMAAAKGQADFALAQAYHSFQQPDKAIEALQRGLKKGSLKSPDEAYLLLGQSYVELKNGAEASKAFKQVKSADLKELANIWSIYASQI